MVAGCPKILRVRSQSQRPERPSVIFSNGLLRWNKALLNNAPRWSGYVYHAQSLNLCRARM
jgi:hypothetical protein